MSDVWCGDRKYDVALMEHHAATHAMDDAKLLRRMLTALLLTQGGSAKVDHVNLNLVDGGNSRRFLLRTKEDGFNRSVYLYLEDNEDRKEAQ